MPTYEYLCRKAIIDQTYDNDKGKWSGMDDNLSLNISGHTYVSIQELGEEGWQLISVVPYDPIREPKKFFVILMRPAQGDA